MARGQKQLVWITPVHFDHAGRPVDPDYGVGEGGHPDQGLPGWGGFPGRPGQGLPGGGWGGGGEWGGDWSRPERPGNRPPGSWGGRPVDPGWGVDAPEGGGEPPVYPIDPENPDQGLPPMVPPGLPELPPGAIWPPLPPSIPPGKAIAVIYISGVGSRWAVIDVPERPQRPVDPDYGVDEGEQPETQPPRPGQGLPRPPTGGRPERPERPDLPVRPGQGLPPTRPTPPAGGIGGTPPQRPGPIPPREPKR
jgi:hypothetical protein